MPAVLELSIVDIGCFCSNKHLKSYFDLVLCLLNNVETDRIDGEL